MVWEFGWKWFGNLVGNGLGIWLEMVWNLVGNGLGIRLKKVWGYGLEFGWKWFGIWL